MYSVILSIAGQDSDGRGWWDDLFTWNCRTKGNALKQWDEILKNEFQPSEDRGTFLSIRHKGKTVKFMQIN